ncbi:hypothetical protein D9M70_618020 [compost metagenome]
MLLAVSLGGHHVDPLFVAMAQQHALQRLAVFHVEPARLSVATDLHEPRHPRQHAGRAVAVPSLGQDTVVQQPAGGRQLAVLLVAAAPWNPHHATLRVMDGQRRIGVGIVDLLPVPFRGVEPADFH